MVHPLHPQVYAAQNWRGVGTYSRLILVVALFLALDLGTCSVESGNSRHTNRKNKLDRSIDVHNHPKKRQAADIAKKLRRQQHQHRFKHFADDDDNASTRSDENTTPGATTTATTSSPSSLMTQSPQWMTKMQAW